MLMNVRSQKGFTLIELLIVVIILGILAVIAIPMFTNNRAQAEQNACRTSLRMLNDAIARYAFDGGAALPAGANAATMTTELATTGGATKTQYIAVFPTCPAGGAYSIATANATADCSVH